MSSRGGAAKNRNAAEIQITAEQLLRESRERMGESGIKLPRRSISSREELDEYRQEKRKEFEDRVRMTPMDMRAWRRYATWEESQRDFAAARSVYERALGVDYKSVTMWLAYASMEMRNKFVNSARNVWDRAVSLLPRVDKLWYKYSYMEEMLGNVDGARRVFERWMDWQPDDRAWMAYVALEGRAGSQERGRAILERYVEALPGKRSFLRWARWEEKAMNVDGARRVYTRALEELEEEARDESLYIAFAKLEERSKEYERARVIYKFGMDALPRARAAALTRAFVAFEKRHGEQSGIEAVIVSKRRDAYEAEVTAHPFNYDAWFDYLRLVEGSGDASAVRELYERAVGNVPPVEEKKYWRRYIYLWMAYALFEEVAHDDLTHARAVYAAALALIPHARFTFSKLWLMAAHAELRAGDLSSARRLLGSALGRAPREKVIEGYIALEMQLGEVDRCRKLFAKRLQLWPASVAAWCKYADMESSLGELERARSIYELAITQPALDRPEALWKAFIDFELAEDETARVHALYNRLLDRTQHVKVWISYAQFAAGQGDVDATRGIFARAEKHLKEAKAAAERASLLTAWREFERSLGERGAAAAEALTARMPNKVLKKRQLLADDGTELGWEEYYDYIFPGEDSGLKSMRFLAAARAWKKRKTG